MTEIGLEHVIAARDAAQKRVVELEKANERLRRELELAWKDSDVIYEEAERYQQWKANGMSYSNGFFSLQIYAYDPDGINLPTPDEVADAKIDAARNNGDT